jgi:hypothetical protein
MERHRPQDLFTDLLPALLAGLLVVVLGLLALLLWAHSATAGERHFTSEDLQRIYNQNKLRHVGERLSVMGRVTDMDETHIEVDNVILVRIQEDKRYKIRQVNMNELVFFGGLYKGKDEWRKNVPSFLPSVRNKPSFLFEEGDIYYAGNPYRKIE